MIWSHKEGSLSVSILTTKNFRVRGSATHCEFHRYNPWPTLCCATTGRATGGTELHAGRHRLCWEEALFHYTVGSAWFSQEERLKGRLRPGQYADFAILNAPNLDVSDNDLKSIEAELTVTGGKPVYGTGSFAGAVEALPEIQPAWSPVRDYGGYQRG